MSYESPIKVCETIDDIVEEAYKGTEDIVYKAVINVDVKVDKEELLKALQYDRGQYDKGYADGQLDAVVHGHWVEKGQEIYCSVCDEESAYTWAGASRFSHYCPSCGAKMDEVSE